MPKIPAYKKTLRFNLWAEKDGLSITDEPLGEVEAEVPFSTLTGFLPYPVSFSVRTDDKKAAEALAMWQHPGLVLASPKDSVWLEGVSVVGAADSEVFEVTAKLSVTRDKVFDEFAWPPLPEVAERRAQARAALELRKHTEIARRDLAASLTRQSPPTRAESQRVATDSRRNRRRPRGAR